MKKVSLIILPLLVGLAGCGSGSGEQAVETKPTEVKQQISQAQQDKITESFKTWTPDKKK